MGYPRIVGVINYTESANAITASTEDTGFIALNVKDRREFTQWRGTGAAEQYLEIDNGPGPLSDTWDNLSAWTETDINATLSVAGGKLLYDSAAFANDNPDINHNGPLTVTNAFAVEFVFDITAWATATTQAVWMYIDFDGTNMLRWQIDNNGGTPRVTLQYDIGGGWVTIGAAYTLGGGTSGRVLVMVSATGGIDGRVFDDSDSTYHLLGTYAGGASFVVTILNDYYIESELTVRVAGSFQWESTTLFHSNDTLITALGIAGHDLATQGATNIRIDASVGGVGFSTFNRLAAFTPSTDRALAKFYDGGAFRFQRLIIPVGYTSPPAIGVLMLATYLQIDALPIAPHDPDAREDDYTENIGGEGHLLGVAKNFSMRTFEQLFPWLERTWVKNTWWPFWNANGRKPIFYLWDWENNPDEASYLRIINSLVTAPYELTYRSLNLIFSGLYDSE